MVSAIDNIVHHVAYGLKALEEYVSNIFTFIGQKSFNFNIYSLFIFDTFYYDQYGVNYSTIINI